MTHIRTSSKRRATQYGNALSETIVLSVVMIPLLFVMASLGKVADLNQSTISAARYAAWERTVHDRTRKPAADIATEIHNRFYVTPDLALRSDQGQLDGSARANGFWGASEQDGNGDQKKLFDASTGQNMFYADKEGDLETAGAVSEAITDVADTLAGVFPDAKWNMEGNGLYVGEVGVNMNKVGLLSQGNLLAAGLDLSTSDCSGAESDTVFQCLIRSNAILVDGWTATTKGQVAERSRSFVPGSLLRPVGNALSKLGNLKIIKELKGLDDAFGHVETDALPLDRYELR